MFRRNPPSLLVSVLIAGVALAANAQIVVQDGFETNFFAGGWGSTAGVTIRSTGGANGTTRCATLAPYGSSTGRELGARFDAVALGGAKDFYVDLFFRTTNTTQRQFHLDVSDSTGAISSSGPAISLKYDVTNGWAAYSTAWNTISNLGTITPGQWYRLRLSGQDWGLASARYAVQVSDAGGTTFTKSATNLLWYQNGNPKANPARFFLFTTVYGNDPGFDVDEVTAAVTAAPANPVTNAILNISGTYPHLAVFGTDGEIGIGAVVPWADRLWFVTYPPHAPNGGPDKLWTVDSNLTLTARPESVGGTDANRMIHRESQQLVIGPYFIDTNANVRAVSPSIMPGRLTATARHLTDPANKVYIATMEEGFYEVNVNTLAVTTLKADAQSQGSGAGLLLPGNHGKGCYSGQGRLLYANNGEPSWNITNDPAFNSPAGLLTENTGADFTNGWSTLERKNFTEITGPGGIYGNANVNDPIWSLGWDKRSVLLKLLDNGTWYTYRLPKGSYTHDSFTGWFTEWPRIREIIDGKMLMHMHGLFYYFPKTFTAANTAGIQPICTYLKMPVDYCWWNGQLVMGRDDSSAMDNPWTGQSNSGLWFGQLSDLEQWGTPAGFGGVWKEDDVPANVPSEAFLVAGFKQRVLHLKHSTAAPVTFALQYDANGDGTWLNLTNITVPANGYVWSLIPSTLAATWVRLVADQDAHGVTAYFHLSNPPPFPLANLFAGVAEAGANGGYSDGIIRSQSGDARTLQFAANVIASNGVTSTAYYQIDGSFQLRRTTNATAEATLRTTYSLSNASFSVDAASVVYTEGTNRFRLPKSSSAYDTAFASGWPRGVREIVTERYIFDAHGTFYELPYATSGGFRRVRPITTHNRHISDFASWRGLFVIAGVAASATNNGHVFRSDDNQTALWFGNVDDLWRMGAPAGIGGPWKNTPVISNTPSDPYLMYGYQSKSLELSHTASQPVTFIVEVDFAADNTWSEYGRFVVPPGKTFKHVFPEGYSAHWVRLRTDTAAVVSALFNYGPAAPQITGLSRLANGNLRLSFSGFPGQAFTVWTTSALSLPVNNWTALTNGAFDSAVGTFDDLPAPDSMARFYTISTP